MSKTEVIQANIEPELKHELEEIFQPLGLFASEANELHYRQIRKNQKIPFMVKTPNAVTRKTMQETNEGKNLVESENAVEMFTLLKFR